MAAIAPAAAEDQVAVRPGAASAELRFETAEAVRTRVEYGQPGRLGLFTQLEPEAGQRHAHRLEALTPSTVYAYRVVTSASRVLERGRFTTTERTGVPRRARPAGRTIEVDGEAFLPILSWAQCPETMGASREVGIDVFVGPPCGDARDQLHAAWGSRALAMLPFQSGLSDYPALLGYHFEDEPDAARITPEQIEAEAAAIRASDPGHITLLTLTRSFHPVFGPHPWLAGDTIAHYRRYAAAADLAGFVLYPYWILCEGDKLPLVGDLQWLFSREVAPGRPTFQWIEAAARNNPACTGQRAVPVSAPEVAAEVWTAVSTGASGIGYFTITMHDGVDRFDVLPDVAAAMRRTNGELKALSGALLAPRAELEVGSEVGRVEAAAWRRNGALYLLAVNPLASESRALLSVSEAGTRTGRDWRSGEPTALEEGRMLVWLAPFESRLLVFPPAG